MIQKHPVLSSVLKFLAAILVLVLLAGIITGYTIAQEPLVCGEYDYLVVLGTTVNGAEPSVMLQDRIHKAFAILSENEDVICIVSGGKGSQTQLSEAQCMYNELTAMGIDPNRIWMEDSAVSTVENLQFSLSLIEAQTGRRPGYIGVLSSDFHMHRVRLLAEEADIDIIPVYAPSTHDFTFYTYFLREIFMVWYYSIF